VRLSDFKGKENVVLFFYLNGKWLSCSQQLGELQEKNSEIKKLNAEVIAFATRGNQYDVESSKGLYRITYPLIPTPNRTVAEDFGVGKSAFGIIIIDKKGRIRYKDISSSMSHSVSIIIRELGGI
jgi:peroxiredoxin Q/BCP